MHPLPRHWLLTTVAAILFANGPGLPAPSAADEVSVVASVDQRQVAFGDSLVYTIEIKGAVGGVMPPVLRVDGLRFDGPSHRQSTIIANGRISHSLQFQYVVTPQRVGEFTIPSCEITVGNKPYRTEPISIAAVASPLDDQLQQALFARVRFEPRQVFLGQSAPLDILLFAREDLPLQGVGGFQADADGLGYKHLNNLKQGAQIIEGQKFNVWTIEGAISPSRTGLLQFGPCAIQAQLRIERRGRGGGFPPLDDPFFQGILGSVEIKQVPVVAPALPIEVLPLPEEGRPADFAGAVGQWNLELTAHPPELTVGEPLTVTIRVRGQGNIDTVPPLKLGNLDEFKIYDPSITRSVNELGTEGERLVEQVLIPKHPGTNQLPIVRLAYFDPVARQYRIATQGPVPLLVRATGQAGPTIVHSGPAPPPREKLGEDIVYLKGDLGPAVAAVPFCFTPTFALLHALPLLALVAAATWKRRADRLRADPAYARRSRAARQARRLLATARSFADLHHVLQTYLGDRLNLPPSGLTASVVDEHLIPRGLDRPTAEQIRACFEACDTGRFAGGIAWADLARTKTHVEQLIDELEKRSL